MERLTIDDMKAIQLELMDELDRVCREQDIRYFLGYGSLLGAVRHGGFIPWDDDMDVVMLRSENVCSRDSTGGNRAIGSRLLRTAMANRYTRS